MDKNSTQQALREYASKGMPANPDLWPVIVEAASTSASIVRPIAVQQSRRLRTRRFHLPTTRLGWATVVLMVLLTVSTATYAATSYINHSYSNDPTFQQIQQSGQQLDLSETIAGRTVILQRVYADADTIQIGYIVQGQKGESLALTAIRLTDEYGNQFHPLLGVQDTKTSDASGYALSFDNSALGERAIDKRLHLTLSLVQSKPEGTPVPMVAPVGSDSNRGTQSQTVPGDIAGPFQFDFIITR